MNRSRGSRATYQWKINRRDSVVAAVRRRTTPTKATADSALLSDVAAIAARKETRLRWSATTYRGQIANNGLAG